MDKVKSRMSKVKSTIQNLRFLVLSCSFAFFALSFFAFICFAKEVNFEITVDKNKVNLGQPLQLDLTFNGTQNMPALDLPPIEGFQARYLGPSTRMSIINGQVSSSITHIYTLLPTKVGVFKIGPFKFNHNGDAYNSNSLSMEVQEATAQPESQPDQEEQAEAKELSEKIFLIIQTVKNRVYLNEIVPVNIKLFVNRLGVRDIQYPQFSHDGFSIGEFQQPKQYQEVIGGINYDVIEFDTAIFGLRPGEFRLGPANLQCNLIVKKQSRRQTSVPFDDFFNSDVFDNFLGRYETYPLSLKSADIPITVLPLPEENKPESFSGALGIFDFEAAVSPLEVKVGDPITLKATVRGQGNFNTINLPKIISGSDFKAYEPQGRQEKEAKTFEQVLIPLNANIKEIPQISFSFFNTQTGKYETITRGPFPVKIVKPEKEEEIKVIEGKHPAAVYFKEEKLGRDIIYIKDDPGQLRKEGEYLYKNKIFLWLQIIPLLFYLLTAAVYTREKRLKTDVKYARQLLAPRKARAGIGQAKNYLNRGSIQEFYDTVFETLQEYLGDKLHLPSKGITISIIDEQLKNRGVPEGILAKLRDIFAECDTVRYAASQLSKENMQNSLGKLEEIIDYFQRNKNQILIKSLVLLPVFFAGLLLFYSASAQGAINDITAHQSLDTQGVKDKGLLKADTELSRMYQLFYQGSRAYKEGNYNVAIENYRRLVALGLESGNLYYNLGNCYFKKGEAGQAVLNYEKALFFIPNDSDLKSNYDYVLSSLNLGSRSSGNKFIKAVNRLFEGATINFLTILLSGVYVFAFAALIVNLFFSGFKKIIKPLLLILILLFILSAIALNNKINNFSRGAVVISKEAEVKFEPLESATTYFKLTEGSKVEVIEKAENWYKIKRLDGKIGWVDKIDLGLVIDSSSINKI